MPAENVRIVVQGVPRAEKEFSVVEVNRAEATRLAELMAKDAKAAERELRLLLRGSGGRIGRR